MLALKGYFNDKTFVALEKVNIKQNQKIIITVLDEFINQDEHQKKTYKKFLGILDDESCQEIVEALKEQSPCLLCLSALSPKP